MAERIDAALDADGRLAALRDAGPLVLADAERELVDLAARADATDLSPGTLDLLDVVVDRLCRDYPTMAPEVLSRRGREHLAYVLRLLDSRTTLNEHRELLVRAGWLAVLLSCTLFDAGDKLGAEVVRRTARRLGEQAGHGEVLAWSSEVAAWFALVERRFGDVVANSEAGLRHAGATNAAVQLTLQASMKISAADPACGLVYGSPTLSPSPKALSHPASIT